MRYCSVKGGCALQLAKEVNSTSISIHPRTVPFVGRFTVPPDKSITHRALFFAALNRGRTVIHHPSVAADPISTLQLLSSLGYAIQANHDRWEHHGADRVASPSSLTLDCGNSGTTARLAAGFLTSERGSFLLTGDRSLIRRPMERVAQPLRRLGAMVETTDGGLPMSVDGNEALSGCLDAIIDVSSAQVHAALLIAGLRSRSGCSLRRVNSMRDHTLRIASAFGIEIETRNGPGGDVDHVDPVEIDCDCDLPIPGDISSAAFLITAALLVPGSEIVLYHVGLNPTRIAFLHALKEMGGDLQWHIESDSFEPVGSITARHSPSMRGITLGVDSDISVAEMIDELPLLAVVASQAEGRTFVCDAAELRLKESDRIVGTATLLRSLGVQIDELEEGFEIHGPQRITGGVEIDHRGDHRLCMMAAVAALIAEEPLQINDPDVALVSFPGFWEHFSLNGEVT